MMFRFDPPGGQSIEFELPEIYDADENDVETFLAAVRRQFMPLLTVTILGVLVGFLYNFTATPKYSATATILIDAGTQKIANMASEPHAVLVDEPSILSQMELIRSLRVAHAVSLKLDLKNNRQFLQQDTGLIKKALGYVRGLLPGQGRTTDQPQSDAALEQDILATLRSNLLVERAYRAAVISISYKSSDPDMSALIAKTYAEAYVAEQLQSKVDSIRRAGRWLQDRITVLEQQVNQSDLAVEKFRTENNLVSSDGQLLSGSQLGQLSAELMKAQADAIKTESDLDGIRKIVALKDVDAVVNASISSPIITDLRDKYLEDSRLAAELSSRYGKNHERVIQIRRQMDVYRQLMFQELERIGQSFETDAKIALSRVENLQTQIDEIANVTNKTNIAEVKLHALMRQADTYREIYKNFLQHYQEGQQQETVPLTDARIITEPLAPTWPVSPRKVLSVVFGAFLGLMFGSAFAAYREWKDRFFRTRDQVQATLGLEFMGNVPVVPAGVRRKRSSANAATDNSRIISRNDSLSSFVLDNPLSAFAETLRSVKIAVDLKINKPASTIVGVVSVFPGEGKSTISVNLAEQFASQGARVLLIDADFRNPGATNIIGRHAAKGILEALEGEIPLLDLVMTDPQTGLSFLPAVMTERIPYSSELLASEAMDRLISQASELYDYVIIDLPPLAPLVDAKAIVAKIDATVLVVEWGKTPRDVVGRVLASNEAVAKKCVGVVLNKVDTRRMKLYDKSIARTHPAGGHYSHALN